jgi:serine/threonine protein kinase
MRQNAGTNITHYKIIRQLGKGGMGEVYLAEDTRLDRQVAIKVLPDALRSDPERLARFRREAKAAASLNHPSIATIHSIEEADNPAGEPVLFIVMEYVDGETLAERIPSDGMDLDISFDTFIPLADALAHAHQQGRVHRDIKPANIMVAKDGTPMILDFGLARIMPIMEPEDVDTQAATRTMDENEQKPPSDPSAMSPGPKLMGTPQYMSPEQAESQELDQRTDIFSFGVVMYEALTGRKAFEGKSRQSLLASIIKADPEPVTAIKPVMPYQLWQVIDRSLRKERTARTQTAYELYHDLKGVQKDVEAGMVLVDASTIQPPEPEPVEPEQISPVGMSFLRQPLALISILLIAAVSALSSWYIKPAPQQPLRKFQWPIETLTRTTISPDGTKVAYVSDDRLWIRDLDRMESREVQDSEKIGFGILSWAPASDFLIYRAGRELRRSSVQGGPSLTLAKNIDIYPTTWRPDGMLILTQNIEGRLILTTVSSQGGEPEVMMAPDSTQGEKGLGAPLVLPDGHTLVFLVFNQNESDALVVQDGDERRVLVLTNSDELLGYPFYAPSGHILYERGDGRDRRGSNRDIWALPFDPDTRQATGDPFIVAQQAFSPSVSEDGTLVYATSSGSTQQLVWVDREGKVTGTIGQPLEGMVRPSLSPDSRQVAVRASVQGNNDIWVYDTQRGTATRLT